MGDRHARNAQCACLAISIASISSAWGGKGRQDLTAHDCLFLFTRRPALLNAQLVAQPPQQHLLRLGLVPSSQPGEDVRLEPGNLASSDGCLSQRRHACYAQAQCVITNKQGEINHLLSDARRPQCKTVDGESQMSPANGLGSIKQGTSFQCPDPVASTRQ